MSDPSSRSETPPAPRPLVLYDGECGLCDRSVRFILRHEAGSRLRFAPLASELARGELRRAGRDPGAMDTVVLLDEAGLHTHSTAAIRIARYFRRPWCWLGWLRLIPRPIRDAGYRFIAARRTQWFGKADVCRLTTDLTPEQRARVLEP